ncbi:hypothetical protein L2Y94_14390 [Luteibacter aegosomatis]|uniref:hypothetical protein n=1 Tax=Luteibacter aegosomatis TaxID=2911537 RepID=UPI001FFC2667|nr:hypothetical protein [Luteibacter aegosomatis]UPG84520.1 hypothetical protein L2Y94_14390 [Luteibacter aegosomatis]
MQTPTTPALARYFSKISLTLNSASNFDKQGRRHLTWMLAQTATGKPFWLGEAKLFASTAELWAAWKAHQLSLHLQHQQALRLVRYYLRHEEQHFESFATWLGYRASTRPALFDDVDTGQWPWTAATASQDRRDRLNTRGWPWSDAPTAPVIRRCMRRSDGNGWASRALKVADFDRQSATRYTAAIAALIKSERRRMFERKMRKTGLAPAPPARRL